MTDSKLCAQCGGEMNKPHKYSQKQWEAKKFCSRTCSAESRKKGSAVSCAQCGTQIELPPSRIKAANFCSRGCASAFRETKVEKPCNWCGKPVKRVPSLMQDTVYCGHECLGKGTARDRGQSEPIKSNCLQCGVSFVSYASDNRKYCSQDCSIDASRQERPPCLLCGKPVTLMRNQYCSKTCAQVDLRSPDHVDYSGIDLEKFDSVFQLRYQTDPEFRQRVKARAKAQYHHPDPQPCSVCGTEKDVHRHHDDYDKPLDIRWLCRGCHVDHHHAPEEV